LNGLPKLQHTQEIQGIRIGKELTCFYNCRFRDNKDAADGWGWMTTCLCGNVAVGGDALCAWCGALRVLGLEPGAGPKDIKAAYRMMAKVWHPDRFQGDPTLKAAAEDKLKAINAAFSYLGATAFKGPPRKDASRESKFGAWHQAWHDSPPAAATAPSSPSEPEPVVRRRPRASVLAYPGMALLVRLLILLAVLGAGAILLKIIDSRLASDPTTGRFYSQYKAQFLSRLGDVKRQILGDAKQKLGALVPESKVSAPSAAQPLSEPENSAANQPATARSGADKPATAKTHSAPIRVLPVITVGLTQEEVVAAQGEPTSSAADKLMYGKSEVDFKDGAVAGWKIDPASPLRVKLWPDAFVDPDLSSFTVGSTKNEVLAVQGTPTLLSEDKFGYGGSEVLFRNGRVASWRSDPESIPLRAVAR
jgi:hypothetical protein